MGHNKLFTTETVCKYKIFDMHGFVRFGISGIV